METANPVFANVKFVKETLTGGKKEKIKGLINNR